VATTVGKIELESAGDETPDERVVERLIARAVYTTFGRWLDVDDLGEIVDAFDAGLVVETGERVPAREYVRRLRDVPGLAEPVRRLGFGRQGSATAAGEPGPAEVASAVEFVLEGLHLARRLNKDRSASGTAYRR